MYACDFAGHDLDDGDRTRWHTPLHATMRRSKERNPTYPVGGLYSLLFSPTTICIVLVISEIPSLRFQINSVCQLSSRMRASSSRYSFASSSARFWVSATLIVDTYLISD